MEKDSKQPNLPVGDTDSIGDRAPSNYNMQSRAISKIRFQNFEKPEETKGNDALIRMPSIANKFLVQEKMDQADIEVTQSKLLHFGSAYVLTKQEQLGMLQKPEEEKHQFPLTEGEKYIDTKGKLIEDEITKINQPPKANEADKYKGKEKEYGLGDQPYHEWDNNSILEYFKNNEKTGFNSEQVRQLREFWGLNRITPKKTTPWIVKLIINMFGGFQIFLWVGGILCLIVYIITEYVDYQTLALGILCFLVVIGTSLFQTYQEGKSDDVMAALKALTPDKVYALRDSTYVELDAEKLVPGDIIKVKKNEKVPADLRVLHSDKLKVNNASLTGENVDINLNPTTDSKTLYEAKNIARMGCNFTNGEGICIVFSIGDHTFFGHIAKSTLNIKRPDSCLTKEIKRLVHIMGGIAITIGVIFLILALVRGYKAIEAVVFMIGIIVANVPEGLLPQMTVALTLTAKKMQKKNVVVTNLEIIETLGAVSVICSDKTGTLTCNRMTASHICYDMDIFEAKYPPNNNIEEEDNGNHRTLNVKNKETSNKMPIDKQFDMKNSSFDKLFEIMLVNSTARFDKLQEDREKKEKDYNNWSITGGDASEAALIKFAQPIVENEYNLKDGVQDYRKNFNIIHEIPFNSNNKWMLKIAKSAKDPNLNNGRYSYYLKGAPERVLSFCTHYWYKGKSLPIEGSKKVEILQLNERLAMEGERVLAFAYKIAERDYPPEYEFPEEADLKKMDFCKFIFVGLISLQDPPRPGVKESISKCSEAGIRVFMVTGDQPLTALSIARQLGLVSSENDGNKLLQEIEEDLNNGVKPKKKKN